jgi:hypothetical protein
MAAKVGRSAGEAPMDRKSGIRIRPEIRRIRTKGATRRVVAYLSSADGVDLSKAATVGWRGANVRENQRNRRLFKLPLKRN